MIFCGKGMIENAGSSTVDQLVAPNIENRTDMSGDLTANPNGVIRTCLNAVLKNTMTWKLPGVYDACGDQQVWRRPNGVTEDAFKQMIYDGTATTQTVSICLVELLLTSTCALLVKILSATRL